MEKVKVLIVEDEMIISSDIKNCLIKSGYNVIGQATNYDEAIDFLESASPDITLLDIQLPGSKNGIDIALEIKSKYNSPFIFLTANSDLTTINKVKVTEPSAFLVKPFNKKELVATIEIAFYNFTRKIESDFSPKQVVVKESLFVKKEKNFIRLDFKDILFIKSDHIYLEIVMTDGVKNVVRGSLNDYINKLPSSFFRCHRSYIINTQFLSSINHNELTILDHTIPVGKKHREELINILNIG